MIILYIILIVLVVIPCSFLYYEDSKNIGSFEDALRSVTLGTYSLQELKDDPDKASTQLLLNSGIVVLIAISIMIFRCFQHRLINK